MINSVILNTQWAWTLGHVLSNLFLGPTHINLWNRSYCYPHLTEGIWGKEKLSVPHCHAEQTLSAIIRKTRLHLGSLSLAPSSYRLLPLLKVYNQPFGLGPLKQSPTSNWPSGGPGIWQTRWWPGSWSSLRTYWGLRWRPAQPRGEGFQLTVGQAHNLDPMQRARVSLVSVLHGNFQELSFELEREQARVESWMSGETRSSETHGPQLRLFPAHQKEGGSCWDQTTSHAVENATSSGLDLSHAANSLYAHLNINLLLNQPCAWHVPSLITTIPVASISFVTLNYILLYGCFSLWNS